MACRFTPVFGFFNLNLNFNSNIYFGKSNRYFPIWIRLSNTRSAFTWWTSPVMPHSLKISIGSGIGFRYPLRNNYSIRTEMGIGASLMEESTIGGVFPYTLNLKDYQYMRIVPAFKFKFTFCKLINWKYSRIH